MTGTVELWGLGDFLALASMCCGKYEPPVSLFSKRTSPATECAPRWWEMCRHVFLMPSDAPGAVWAAASDGRSSVAFEFMGEWRMEGDLTLPVDTRLLPDLSKKSPNGGLRFDVSATRVIATHLHKGYTNKVGETYLCSFGVPGTSEFPDGWRDFALSMREVPGAPHSVEMAVEADAMGRALSVLGSRLDHWFYAPARVAVSGWGKSDVYAWGGSRPTRNRAVMRCAARGALAERDRGE